MNHKISNSLLSFFVVVLIVLVLICRSIASTQQTLVICPRHLSLVDIIVVWHIEAKSLHLRSNVLSIEANATQHAHEQDEQGHHEDHKVGRASASTMFDIIGDFNIAWS